MVSAPFTSSTFHTQDRGGSMENADVAENVAADIFRHEKKTITYGLYSGGSTLTVRKLA
jgi:hypothetical protein